jgi:adenylylsulfate kinase
MKKCPTCGQAAEGQLNESEITNAGSTLWFTGLPCSGKTTLAVALYEKLKEKGLRVFHLDGDVVRTGLCFGLGFGADGREENIRRIAHVADMVNAHGMTVFSSFITPTTGMRELIKSIIPNVKIIHVKCSVPECERRDVKGMWKKARAGDILGFTGVDGPYEVPEHPNWVVDTEKDDLETCVDQLIAKFFPELVSAALLDGQGI